MKSESFDIKIQAFSKIQQAQPSHLSTLLNKQVGAVVHVETDKTYKIKNCIDSQKTNAQLYKKFSKEFISNVRKGEDQMILCCGLQENARIQTSIGCKKNPGLFLIAGIGVLDEKYQQDFTKFDIQISFMEYSEGKMYDLLSYTRNPLRMIKNEENICFGETYCKISTFNQFLKLFKIALFNNKERDIKIDQRNTQTTTTPKIKSTFIMTIITKRYSNFLRNHSTEVQKSIVIDFAESKLGGNPKQSGNQKNLWDYILIEFNNLSCRKKLYYHLVQPNPLLLTIKNYLKNGKSFIISSLNTNAQYFEQSYKFLMEIYDYADVILAQAQQNSTQNQLINSLVKENFEHANSKKPTEKQLVDNIVQQLENLTNSIKNKKYASLRHYRQLKQKNLHLSDCLLEWIEAYRRIFARKLQNKRKLKLAENQIIADQIKLIGLCVKTDHYKDFYEAKSYLALERQIGIKTEDSREAINKFIKSRYQIKDKFHELRTKHLQTVNSIDFQGEKEGSVKDVTLKTLDFFMRAFFNLLFYSQRTITDEVLRQQQLFQNLNLLSQKLHELQKQICEMSQKGKIQFEMNAYKKDAHLAFLVHQVREMTALQHRKHYQKLPRAQDPKCKKENIQKQNMNESENESIKARNSNPTKFTKLPNLSEKKICFQLSGSLNLSNLLFNPNESL